MEFRLIYRKTVESKPSMIIGILSDGNGTFRLIHTVCHESGNHATEIQGSAEKIKAEFNLIINQANEKRERYAKDKKLQAQEI